MVGVYQGKIRSKKKRLEERLRSNHESQVALSIVKQRGNSKTAVELKTFSEQLMQDHHPLVVTLATVRGDLWQRRLQAMAER